MGDNGTIWLPEGASTLAPEVDALFYFVYWTSVVIFTGVVAVMIYLAYRHRRQDPMERPAPVHESKLVEVTWIVIPTILVLITFVWGFRVFIKIGVAPPESYEVRVQAQMWNWQYTYPNGVSSNELRVPEDRPVRLVMNSTDVIHSFFVPAFRVKHDVLPNRYTSVWFQANDQGTYQVFCTEYCGTEHSNMMSQVTVMEQGAFNEWVKTGGIDPATMNPVELGEALYAQQGCQSCHSLDGSRMVGPTFQNLFGSQRPTVSAGTVEADENYLRESIVQPSAKIVEGYGNMMPAVYSSLTEEQIDALIAFIKAQD